MLYPAGVAKLGAGLLIVLDAGVIVEAGFIEFTTLTYIVFKI